MNTHCLNRISDFIRDPRLPHNFIRTVSRTRKFSQIMENASFKGDGDILVAVTFDVEREYGSFRAESGLSVPQFLKILPDMCRVATLFVEGSLVETNSDTLRSLQENGIEMGVHGFYHELWGPAQWYLADKPLSLREKELILDRGVRTFESSRLRRPYVFRAPNLVADDVTINLLRRKGFSVDSSQPAFRGAVPVPQLVDGPNGIVRIPVTADPTPFLTRMGPLPYCRFRMCDLKTLTEMTEEQLLEYVSRLVSLQSAFGFPPHIVFLSHSWEYFPPLMDKFSYCSPSNLQFMKRLMRSLSEKFHARFVSITELAHNLFDNF